MKSDELMSGRSGLWGCRHRPSGPSFECVIVTLIVMILRDHRGIQRCSRRLAIDKLKLLMIIIKISRSGLLASLLLPLFLFAFTMYDRRRLATVLLQQQRPHDNCFTLTINWVLGFHGLSNQPRHSVPKHIVGIILAFNGH
jgi:hypothetical protein